MRVAYVASRLNCSERNISKYYGFSRAEGVVKNGELVGVVIVGRPVSRHRVKEPSMWEAIPMTRTQWFLWNWLGVWTAPGPKPRKCGGCRNGWIVTKNPRSLCGDCTGGQ
jgi:hypothetical protein